MKLTETVEWKFTDFSEAENPDGGDDEAVDDDRYYYTTNFYGVDYFMDVYVTKGAITDHTCSRVIGNDPQGYLYVSDFKVPASIIKDIEQREALRTL